MNVILFDEQQQIDGDCYQLNQRQFTHLHKVIKVKRGQLLRVGTINGAMGEGVYSDDFGGSIQIQHLNHAIPSALPVTLILALPRPNMLKRTLLNITSMGVKHIVLLHSEKVEKSFWQSPVLQASNLENILIEGLEQARDTIMPTIQMMPRFRPFVEDWLPTITQGKRCFLAHPYEAKACPVQVLTPSILAIGPEGGWNDFEINKWQEAGFESVHLGDRILKVETAVTVLLARMFPQGVSSLSF